MAGMLRDEGAQRFLRRVRRGGKCRSRAVTRGDLLEQTALHQAGHQTLKNRLHRRGDAQGIGGELRAARHAHFAQTVRELRGGEVVAGGHGRLQFLAAAHGDDLFQRGRGGGLQLFEWQRRERRGLGCRRRALPIHVVNHVARATRRAGAADARDADRAEAIDEHARLAGFVVETDPAFDEFLVALQDPGAHAHGRARRAEEKDARKTHRQFHARTAILDGRGTGGEGLQRAVEEHRMQRVFAGAAGDRLGQAPRGPPSGRAPAESSRIGRNSSP